MIYIQLGFKEQMTQLTRKIKMLEKETKNWKQRYDKSNVALIELIDEKKIRDIELINTTKKLGINGSYSCCNLINSNLMIFLYI